MNLKLIIGFFFILLMSACSKQPLTTNPDARLTADVDTLHFDTVFTTVGSITQSFKIFNTNDRGIHIDRIQLAGGTASPFKINIAGQSSVQVTDLDIDAGDSTYIFVSVHIDPTRGALPFVVRDSVQLAYNGNTTNIQLEAYGQNAHFYRNKTVIGKEVWSNDLPYVILGQLVVAAKSQLDITKGCKVYVHAGAPVVVNGTLRITGQKWDSTRVLFTGDRLDDPYNKFPAGWPGILFSAGSTNNQIQYATIQNAYQGIVVQEPATNNNPKLIIQESTIDNAYDIGLAGIHSSIDARNVLVSNCGKNIVLAGGGSYQFTHCTAVTYANVYIQHKEPVLSISNTWSQTAAQNLSATFRNCIIWAEGGLVSSEVAVNKEGNTLFNVVFDHVLWPLAANPDATTVMQAINSYPEFDSTNTVKPYYNFRLKETSPAIDAGINTGLTIDLDGNKRPIGLPDIGAYERQ